MPVPYGTSRQSTGQPDLVTLLPLASAGAGLLAYLLAFLDAQAGVLFAGVPGFSIITAAAAVGVRRLPKSPNTLYAAVPLAAAGALVLLQVVLRGGVDALVIIIMVLALLQLGSVVGALLLETGVVGVASASQSRPAPVPPRQGGPGPFRPPQGGWSPPQQGGPPKPGPFPAPGVHHAPPPPGGPGAPNPFPPPGPPQGGWRLPQTGEPASPPPGSPSAPPPSGLSGTLSSPDEPSEPPASGGPQGTQHLPFPASPDES